MNLLPVSREAMEDVQLLGDELSSLEKQTAGEAFGLCFSDADAGAQPSQKGPSL